MAHEAILAYCIKCRAKREMASAEPIFLSNGAPATQGLCPVCGSRIIKLGKSAEHVALAKPERPKAQDEKQSTVSNSSGKKLVIVESPAKARTISRFLGSDYAVKASVGHIRDLPRSKLGVDVENGFAPQYLVPKEKRQIVAELRKAAERASDIYLATDPDREGEAIAWHLVTTLGLSEGRYRRAVFHEITPSAVAEGFAHARQIDMALVNAQQARRILDRLVGYKISPILWRKVRSRLSAGRVQSVALRLVVEREREIQAFVPEEYWTIEAELAKREPSAGAERRPFIAKLVAIDGKEARLKNEADVQAVVAELKQASYVVSDIAKGQRQRRPPAPFTTSTLQQEAGNRLGFSAKRTMAVAQSLYEGVDLGELGHVGLITYMRTDSVQVAAEAQREAREFIAGAFGPSYLPPEPPQYKARSRLAQEAHEAIRPTSVFRQPDALKPYLTADQYRLYDLIWRRFLGSQMTPALYDTTTVNILAGIPSEPLRLAAGELLPLNELSRLTEEWRYRFRASSAVLRFPGYLRVYSEPDKATEEDKKIPELSAGELLDLLRLLPEQHFTEPPPRYTEATLVRALEELGIGRPSTYAPILSTIQERGYVAREGRALRPTELGFAVNDLLVEHFSQVMDYGFTAQMEEELDHIAQGEREWVRVLSDFYGPFQDTVQLAERNMPKVEVREEDLGLSCPQCGRKLVIKWGRFGKFIACSNYPACRYTQPYLLKVGVACPLCGGDLLERKSKKGRTFYGCSNYPKCTFTTWKRPVAQPCPICGGLLTESGKKGYLCIKCGQIVRPSASEDRPAVPIKTPKSEEKDAIR